MVFSAGLFMGGLAIYAFLAQTEAPVPAAPPQAEQGWAPVEPAPADLRMELDAALAEIDALRAEVDALKAEVEAKDSRHAALDRELAELREQLARETHAEPPPEHSPPAPAAQPAAAPAVQSPPNDAPAPLKAEKASPAESSAEPGEVVRDTGTFVLRAGDAWKDASESGAFRVLDILPADENRLDRAEVAAFGNRGFVERGAQVTHAAADAIYTLIVTRVNGKTGALELLVERER